MNSVKRFVRVFASLLTSTGIILSVSPAYSQSFGRLDYGFSRSNPLSRSGTTGPCGTSGLYHYFSISSAMRVGITVNTTNQDPTFRLEQLAPSRGLLTSPATNCSEDDESGNSESDWFDLSPGEYRINVGNYTGRQTNYTISIYECRLYDCRNRR